jgi:nucleoside-diphosphate-sugar epimerase
LKRRESRMRVFVAGATGYVGSAIVAELLQNGHQVLGLARSEASVETLQALGVEVHRGDLEDVESLRSAASVTDGVIYAANKHITETTNNASRARAELAAVEAIGDALADTGKPFVVTSGLIGRMPGQLLIEDAPILTNPLTALRLPVELAALALAERGVRSSSVRLAPTVHGEGDSRGFISLLVGIARSTRISAFVGDGSNEWPAVNRLDAASLFRLALESAPAGTAWHAAGEQGVPFREIAEAIGREPERKGSRPALRVTRVAGRAQQPGFECDHAGAARVGPPSFGSHCRHCERLLRVVPARGH